MNSADNDPAALQARLAIALERLERARPQVAAGAAALARLQAEVARSIEALDALLAAEAG